MSEKFSPELEDGPFNITDGMRVVKVPPYIDKNVLKGIFGGALPENISPDVLKYLNEGGTLELEQ